MKTVVVAPLPAFPEYIRSEASTTGVRCAESSYPPKLSVAEHVHDKASITIILGGAFVESKGRVAKARCVTGTAVLRRAGEAHANQIDGNGAVNLEIELGDRVSSLCDLDELRSSVITHPAVANAASRLRGELRIRDAAHRMLIEGLALEVAGHAVRQVLIDGGRRRPLWLERACERLRAECLRDVTLDQLARDVGVHPMSLTRAFRVHVGMSPGTFVRMHRITWAATQLANGNGSITEIAVAAGFYDHSHFAHAFSRQMGRTPSAYRRLFASAGRRSRP